MGWVDDAVGSAAIVAIVYLVRSVFILLVHLALSRTPSKAGADAVRYDRVEAVAESFVDGIFFSDAVQDKALLRTRRGRGVLLCTGLSGLAFAAVFALEVGFVFLDGGRTRDAVRTSAPIKLDLLRESTFSYDALSSAPTQFTSSCYSNNGSSPYSAYDLSVEYNTICVDLRVASDVGDETTGGGGVPVSTNVGVLAASTGSDGAGPRVFLVIPKRPGEPLDPSVDNYLQDRRVFVIRFRALIETLDSSKLVSYVVLPSLATQKGAEHAHTVFQSVMKTAGESLTPLFVNDTADGNINCQPVPVSFASDQAPAAGVFGAFEFQCDPAAEVRTLAVKMRVALQAHVGLSASKLELEDGNELTAVFARSVVRGIPFRVSVALIAVALFLLLAKFVGGRKQLSLDRCAVLVAAGGANVPPDASQDWKSTHTAVCAI
jgi:hypothetical protein